MKPANHVAKKHVVKGRVQGVGFRAFVERAAKGIGVRGWVRNLSDGSVEVYAVGTPEQLAELEGYLWKGPSASEVRNVDAVEAAVETWNNFQVRY